MIQQRKNFICENNDDFINLIDRLISLVSNKNKSTFSSNFNNIIIDVGEQPTIDNSTNYFTGKYSKEFISIFLSLFKIWQQIQEDDLPFSYDKEQLSQKSFEQKLILTSRKLEKLKTKLKN